nr:plasmid mobilization relaxosome protein MobC [Pseudomonas sp. NFPP33]AGH89246.1 hypothetical protein [uncultured bacterium]
MSRKDAVLNTPVDAATKAAFADRAKAKGMKPAALLRQLVLAELGAESDPLDLGESAIKGRIEVERSTVRMPGFIQDAAKDRAQVKGMSLSRWIAALVQSNVLKDPVLTDKELLAIRAMNRELAAIGRNINQIAKALNSSIDGIERSRVSLDALDKVPAAIAVCRRVIRDLSRKSQQSWVSDDE